MPNLSASDKYELEKLIDKAGPASVAYEIGAIAFEKSEHIIANYQDRSLTSYWNRIGTLFDNLSATIDTTNKRYGISRR